MPTPPTVWCYGDDRAALAAHRLGARIENRLTLHTFAYTSAKCWHSRWRQIVCTEDPEGRYRDIVECIDCGEQREVACNLDKSMRWPRRACDES